MWQQTWDEVTAFMQPIRRVTAKCEAEALLKLDYICHRSCHIKLAKYVGPVPTYCAAIRPTSLITPASGKANSNFCFSKPLCFRIRNLHGKDRQTERQADKQTDRQKRCILRPLERRQNKTCDTVYYCNWYYYKREVWTVMGTAEYRSNRGWENRGNADRIDGNTAGSRLTGLPWGMGSNADGNTAVWTILIAPHRNDLTYLLTYLQRW